MSIKDDSFSNAFNKFNPLDFIILTTLFGSSSFNTNILDNKNPDNDKKINILGIK